MTLWGAPWGTSQSLILCPRRSCARVPALAGLKLSQLDATRAPNLVELKRSAERFGLTRATPTARDVAALVIRDPRPFPPKRLYDV